MVLFFRGVIPLEPFSFRYGAFFNTGVTVLSFLGCGTLLKGSSDAICFFTLKISRPSDSRLRRLFTIGFPVCFCLSGAPPPLLIKGSHSTRSRLELFEASLGTLIIRFGSEDLVTLAGTFI